MIPHRARIAALVLALTMAAPSWAVEPDEVLNDPVLEARARSLSAELRCVVCRNQSIDDSAAEVARDLRVLLRERLVAGDSDEKAVDYLVARYGTYILLKPPLNATTVMLWAGPLLLLVTAFFGFRLLWSSGKGTAVAGDEFTDEDRALIAAALNTKDAE